MYIFVYICIVLSGRCAVRAKYDIGQMPELNVDLWGRYFRGWWFPSFPKKEEAEKLL